MWYMCGGVGVWGYVGGMWGVHVCGRCKGWVEIGKRGDGGWGRGEGREKNVCIGQ